MVFSRPFQNNAPKSASADAVSDDPQISEIQQRTATERSQPPIRSTTGVYVTVHGHFYQPPRENPYLNAIERQPSASPFHNWNERIHHECYRPNAFARVSNDRGEVVGIVNNFEYLSFNIGPTLMSWLEQHDPETYQRILEADRKSCDRLEGHGNAIAQVYNHIIMPLANERDKRTQIRWGKADFRQRFGRDPEGMWLAETAVDYATLEALVAEGIRFIILAPSQAERCRPMHADGTSDAQWIEVGGSQVDPSRPYRCYLKNNQQKEPTPPGKGFRSPLSTFHSVLSQHSNSIPTSELADKGTSVDPQSLDRPYIDIFFYDGPISRDMGFSDALSSSQMLTARLGQAVRGDHRQAQLVSVATDGETFGHHKGGTEKALAYAFTNEFARHGWVVTNFAHYLSFNPPSWEVELKPVTAWSCSHGVDRWQDDCGCGGGGSWNQQWRRPLREALDWLRDRLIDLYEKHGSQCFKDPWKARDEYIQVIGDRSPSTLNRFLAVHQRNKLTNGHRADALRLLEMQRHALLMYTSCGWFFEEVSRPEGVQILRYAARALELAEEVSGIPLEKQFIKRLAAIPSNVDLFENGADIYRKLVAPARVTFPQVAAHYAMSSLFNPYPQEHRVYCYTAVRDDHQLQRIGTLALAVGDLHLTSEITREHQHLVFAVLHLGGWDFHCCIQPFTNRRAYTQVKLNLFEAFKQGSAAKTILAMSRAFGDQSYSLQDLFAEERHRIMRMLTQGTLTRLDQLYTQVYRDNYGVLMAFHRDEVEVPQELQVAAEIAIGNRAAVTLQALERETSDLPPANLQLCWNHLAELEAIATEATTLHCQIRHSQIKPTLERLILRSLWYLLKESNGEDVETMVRWIEQLIDVGNRLQVGVAYDRAQELYWRVLGQAVGPQAEQIAEQIADEKDSSATNPVVLKHLLSLGKRIVVNLEVD